MDSDQNEVKIDVLNLNENLNEAKDNDSMNIENKKENFITKLKSKKGLLGVLGSFLLILLKFKFILILILSKFKFLLIVLKLGKFASTIASMLLMIVVYAKMYGWAFGFGFVMLLFIHEMGHYLSAKAIKLDVTSFIYSVCWSCNQYEERT